MPRIAIDTTSPQGDPSEVVRAAAAVSLLPGLELILVGPEDRLQAALNPCAYEPTRIRIVPCGTTSGRPEAATPSFSLQAALGLVRDGEADAVVTSAPMSRTWEETHRALPLLPGLRRAALAATYPRTTAYAQQDSLGLLLDVATTEPCTSDDLFAFALLGSAWAACISRIPAPRIGLLNVTTDEQGGGEVRSAAYRKLRDRRGLNFVGNIRGESVSTGAADVVVTDGFTGGIVADLLSTRTRIPPPGREAGWRGRLGLSARDTEDRRLRQLGEEFGYAGAPVLGFEAVVVHVPPPAPARVLANAMKVAARAIRDELPATTRASLEKA